MNKWLNKINEDGWYFMKIPKQKKNNVVCVEVTNGEIWRIADDLPFYPNSLIEHGFLFMKINLPD